MCVACAFCDMFYLRVHVFLDESNPFGAWVQNEFYVRVVHVWHVFLGESGSYGAWIQHVFLGESGACAA